MAVITIDQLGWTQDQKNMTTAMAVQLLHTAGVTYDSIKDRDGVITLAGEVTAAKSVADTLTKKAVEDAYTAWKVLNDAATAVALAEDAKKDAEVARSEWTAVKLDDVDALVGAAKDVAELKLVVAGLCRYIKARGL